MIFALNTETFCQIIIINVAEMIFISDYNVAFSDIGCLMELFYVIKIKLPQPVILLFEAEWRIYSSVN